MEIIAAIQSLLTHRSLKAEAIVNLSAIRRQELPILGNPGWEIVYSLTVNAATTNFRVAIGNDGRVLPLKL